MNASGLAEIERLLAPIPGGHPAGIDLKHSPTFDQIRVARRTAEASPEERQLWTAVATLAQEALAERSKDLHLATWLLDALVRTRGFAGATEGLNVVHGLIVHYWDDLYPALDVDDDEPLAARAALLDWLNEQLAIQLKTIALTDRPTAYGLLHYETSRIADAAKKRTLVEAGWPTPEQFDAEITAASPRFLGETRQEVLDAAAALTELESACSTAFDSLASRFGRLEITFGASRRALENCEWLLGRALPAQPEPVQPGESEVQVPTSGDSHHDAQIAVQPPPDPAPGPPAPAVALSDRDAMLRHLRDVAAALREDDPRSPLPYLLARAIAVAPLLGQGSIDQLQPLAAPATSTRQRLRSLLADQQWSDLLEESERELGRIEKQAWLDPQRYSVIAMEQLGDYPAAVAAVRTQLQALLDRCPDVLTAELDDGTTAAGRDTQEWLRLQFMQRAAPPEPVGAAPPPGPAREAAADPPPPPPPDAAWDRALALVGAARAGEAIALLQSRVDAATSGRERFSARLQLAELCHLAGSEALAYAIVDELARQADEHRLEHWEPAALLVRVWATLYRSGRQLEPDDPSARARVKEAFDRVCRLDPARAMTIGTETATPGRGR